MKHLPKIEFKPIAHKLHRYETVGDYWNESQLTKFRVSKMNADYEFLVLMHEMIEWYLTQKRNIKEKNISKFDIEYEHAREMATKAPCGCLPTRDSEPGFDKHAPYLKEHTFATKIEKLLAKELGVDWDKYDETVMNL